MNSWEKTGHQTESDPGEDERAGGPPRQILSVVWRYVKPGGRLIYSTCTVDSMENEENARWFAGNFPFEPVDLRPALEPRFPAESLKEGWIQFLPGIHPMDGFFNSLFTRKNG